MATAATGREVLLVLFSTPTDDSTDLIPASVQCFLTKHGNLIPSGHWYWEAREGKAASKEDACAHQCPEPLKQPRHEAWLLQESSLHLINCLGSSINPAPPALLALWALQALLELVPFSPCRAPVHFSPLRFWLWHLPGTIT